MKLIQCIVRPVTSGITAREIRSLSPEGHKRSIFRGVAYETLLPWVDDIVRIVAETPRTGEVGDEESYHVRTGFMDS